MTENNDAPKIIIDETGVHMNVNKSQEAAVALLRQAKEFAKNIRIDEEPQRYVSDENFEKVLEEFFKNGKRITFEVEVKKPMTDLEFLNEIEIRTYGDLAVVIYNGMIIGSSDETGDAVVNAITVARESGILQK